MTSVRILRRDDVRDALPMAACIDAVQAAFVAYSAGRAELPSVIHLDVPEAEGEIHVKAGHIHGAPAYAVKVASGFYAEDPAAIDGLVLVFDAATGAPVAFLLDGGLLTDLRTGAAGGVAARWLAPDRRRRRGRDRHRDPGASAGRGASMRATGARRRSGSGAATWIVRCVPPTTSAPWSSDSVQEAVTGASVVITATAAREPLVEAAWIAPGTHITAVGSDGVGKQELDPGAAATRRRPRGRFGRAVPPARRAAACDASRPTARWSSAGSARARSPGAPRAAQLTICDLTGVGVQDVAAANAVLANAPVDAGERVEL